MQTISLEHLASVTGGGTVDRSMQSHWIDQTLGSMQRNGMGINNSGLRGVRNPDMTNVIRFPGR